MNNIAVSYLRYSHSGQNETSIDGQRKAINAFAKENGYTIIKEYIDRERTGTEAENRKQFQQMIEHSKKKQFEYVLVYQFDRFSRDTYDSAIYKKKLKDNGVKVKSVTENFSDDATGQLTERLVEGLAEYFSKDLSQKVKRGNSVAADRCQYLGGSIPLGYKVNNEKKYEIDELTACIVKECFDLMAGGMSMTKIGEHITKKYSTDGKPYFKNPCNALRNMFKNKFYIGIYCRIGRNIVDGVPRIVSDEKFEMVQKILQQNKKAPARARAVEVEYILTGKLFCGHCGEGIFGTSGTSQTRKTHHYYSCKKRWQGRGCNKKHIKKDLIEQLVLAEARKQLSDENINIISKEVSELSKYDSNALVVSDIKRQIRTVNKALERLMDAIEEGAKFNSISDRIGKKEEEKATLEIALTKAQIDNNDIEESEIRFFLNSLKSGAIDDDIFNRMIITIFIQTIYLYDDRFKIIFNATGSPVEIDYSLVIDDIEINNEVDNEKASNSNINSSSYKTQTGVPY